MFNPPQLWGTNIKLFFKSSWKVLKCDLRKGAGVPNKETFVSSLKEANIQLSPTEPGRASGSLDPASSDDFWSLSVQTAHWSNHLSDRSSPCRLSRNSRQKLQRNRTPLRSRWCRWRRRTSPWSRPPTRWTSAPWAASPETPTQRPILPNLQPAPPCQSPRCSRSCRVRERERLCNDWSH